MGSRAAPCSASSSKETLLVIGAKDGQAALYARDLNSVKLLGLPD